MRISNIAGYKGIKQNNNFKRNVHFKSSLSEHFSQGAKYSAMQGTRFTLQAPLASAVSLLVSRNDDYNHLELYPLHKQGDKFSGIVKDVKVGDKYKYVVQKNNGEYFKCYDPRADYLPNDIDGFKPNSEWCEVIDHKQFNWSDDEWMRNRAIRDVRGWHLPDDMILESLHIGLLGGFKNAKKEIDNIVRKGVANTIRVMPVGEFYGDINWGYDEVAKYAPENAYGRPEDFKDFINYAHKNNIRVILDVVPNHFGVIGSIAQNLMPIYSQVDTPWGKSLEFNGENGKYMKSYMTDMLMNWAINYHVDGFRFDATHYMDSDTGIQDIMYDLRSHDETKDLILYSEDMRLSRIISNENQPKEVNEKNWGFNGLTNFDFFKALITLATGYPLHGVSPDLSLLEKIYKNGIDKSHEEKCINDGKTSTEYKDFCRRNLQYPNFSEKNLLVNLSNHDEIGNSAGGKRNLINILSARLGMVLRMNDDWKAAQKLIIEMTKDYVKEGTIMPDFIQRQKGCVNPVNQETFKGEFAASFALNKLVIGATLLSLSPKEFFMGDDECELAPFKFFANYQDKNTQDKIAYEKGYQPDYTAFNESQLQQDDYTQNKYKQETLLFTQDFLNIVKESRIQTECAQKHISTYAHKSNNDNILELKYPKPDGTELIAVMNFSGTPYNSFTLRTTSHDTNLREIINSNSGKYGGTDWFLNSYNNNNLQAKKVILPPHSIVVFETKKF